jgi:hypothetical protein
MATKLAQLEERLIRLEAEVRELKTSTAETTTVPWHRRILGEFKDDPVFDEIVRLGKELRDKERSPKRIRPKQTRRKGA